MNETIRVLREEHGYSQSYLASCLGISRQMYIKYENGEVAPSVQAVKAMCKLYSVSYSTIIDNKLKPAADMAVAEPAPAYGVTAQDTLIDKLQMLSAEKYKTAISFINYLIQEENSSPKKISKKAFFALEGKVKLDPKEVEAFREASIQPRCRG
ncbi:MAG: helix-turn-helix domain-containing protein [Spirochaetia bacterium]|nr:helix-turn-helix domain-containing protein [Spirochaetia bacterium]